jgi:hypothetical protein
MYESHPTFVFDICQLTEIYVQRIVAAKSDSYFKTRLLMACYCFIVNTVYEAFLFLPQWGPERIDT